MDTKMDTKKLDTNDTFIKLHNLYFTATLVSIVEIVKQGSIDYCQRKKKTNKNNLVLQKMCNDLLLHYKKDSSDNIDNLDTGDKVDNLGTGDNVDKAVLSERKVLVKIYSMLRTHSEFLLDKNPELFNIKDEKNIIQTIIPGVDIGLVYKKLSESDTKRIWKLFSLLFITSTRIVHSISGDKIKEKYKELVKNASDKLEKYLEDEGINVKQMLFNPFLGLGEDNENYGLDELFAGLDKNPSEPGKHMDIESIVKNLGINIDDLDKNIREKCKDITDDEINTVTGKITEIFGGEGDSTINEVCSTMIKHVIEDVKDHGIKDMKKTTQNTFSKIEKEIGKKKLKKAVNKMKKKVGTYKGGAGGTSGIINELINNHIQGEGVGGIVQQLGNMLSGKK